MFGDVCRLCTRSHTIASNLRVALSANYEEGHTDRFRASLWQCRWWFAIAISLRLCTPRRPHGSMSVWLTFISSTFHWLIVGRFKDFFKCCAKKNVCARIREAPPLRSARGGQADDTPRHLAPFGSQRNRDVRDVPKSTTNPGLTASRPHIILLTLVVLWPRFIIAFGKSGTTCESRSGTWRRCMASLSWRIVQSLAPSHAEDCWVCDPKDGEDEQHE